MSRAGAAQTRGFLTEDNVLRFREEALWKKDEEYHQEQDRLKGMRRPERRVQAEMKESFKPLSAYFNYRVSATLTLNKSALND